jgi:NAD(P)-dependent dehydrogenase (short-subunit alcohol dehydrogenase family)
MTGQKSIVITGSTRGIGKGIARELLQRGYLVTISGRSQPAVDLALSELAASSANGGRALGVACDVSSGPALQQLWDASKAAFGRVDIWVNNAGISHDRQYGGELRDSDVFAVQETNLLGMMLATQIAMKGMQAQGGGIIYNMEGFGSNGMTTPGMGLYGASKFALTYFNKCLIAETAGSPVKICYLSPGIVITDLLKRDMGSTSEKEWERTQRIYNILADRVETVTPYLAAGILANEKAGARVAWLTSRKAAARFFGSLFRKRRILTEADLAH